MRATSPPYSAPGCAVGYETTPYPIAYNFLSSSYKQQQSYQNFYNGFFHIGHINLINLIKDETKTNNGITSTYMVELEEITTGSYFSYSFGWIQLEHEDGSYKIKNINLLSEDFFYPDYYGWIHNAEKFVANYYGNPGLIQKQYPTSFDGYTKEICVKTIDGNSYLFKFAHLTNGTEIVTGKYILCNGKWVTNTPTKLEDALKKIESDAALQQKYIQNPKGVLEELGVDTSGLTITTEPQPSDTPMLRGNWTICPSVCVGGAGFGGVGYNTDVKPPEPPEPPVPPKPEPAPKPIPPLPEPKPEPTPKPLPPGSIFIKPPEE